MVCSLWCGISDPYSTQLHASARVALPIRSKHCVLCLHKNRVHDFNPDDPSTRSLAVVSNSRFQVCGSFVCAWRELSPQRFTLSCYTDLLSLSHAASGWSAGIWGTLCVHALSLRIMHALLCKMSMQTRCQKRRWCWLEVISNNNNK